MGGRRPDIDFGILVAQLAPLALLVILWWRPDAMARIPIALLAVLWAPGHLGLSLIYPLGTPHLSGLERASLACALGLLALPVMGLALSLAWSLTSLHVAIAYLFLTAVLGGVTAHRTPREPRRRPFALTPPGTRLTIVLCVCALTVAGTLWALPDTGRPSAGAALSLEAAAEVLGPFPREVQQGEGFVLNVQLEAGNAACEGRLVVHVEGPDGTNKESVILDAAVQLASGEARAIAIAVPPLEAGTSLIVIRWELPDPRTLHLWFDAGPTHAE